MSDGAANAGTCTLMSIATSSFALWGVLLTEMRYRAWDAIAKVFISSREAKIEDGAVVR